MANLDAKQQRAMLVTEIRELTKIIKSQGWSVTGSTGQTRLNPAVAERKKALSEIRKLDKEHPQPEKSDLDAFLESQ